MKKYLSVLMVAGLLFSFSSFVLAEDDNTNEDRAGFSEKREDFKDVRDARREDFKKRMETFRGELKTDREAFVAELRTRKEEFRKFGVEKVREFWNKAQDMVSRRFEMAVNNLENLQARVGSMIDKLEAEGKDTAPAREALSLSKQKLTEAKAKLAQIKALLPATGEKVTPEIFEKIKLLAREAKDLLKESRENLREAIKAIKELRGEEDGDNDKDSQ